MEQLKQNKELVIRYYNAISGVIKTKGLIKEFMTDEKLMDHIAFFDGAFPKYEVFADELTAEGNRVVVRAHWTGCHKGEFNGIPPTYRNVNFPFVICYEIENGKIVHHWIIADLINLMEQLGVMNVPA